MNTVGFPKARWYPDLWPKSKSNDSLMTLTTPRMNLTSIDWTNYQYTGLNNFRSGPPGPTVALTSASTYVMLNLLGNIYSKPPGWSFANGKSVYATALYTNTSATKVQSISIQGSAVIDTYNHAKETGPTHARLSPGMIGILHLTVPMLTTWCNPRPVANLSAGTTLVQVSEPSTSNAYLNFQIASDAKWNFTGAHWVLRLQQVLFPLDFWLAYPGRDGVNYNSLRPGPDTFPTYPPSATEVSNLRRLAKQFSLMLPYLNGGLPGSSLAEQLVLAARNLRSSRLGFETEIDSLTPAVGSGRHEPCFRSLF